MTETRDLSLFVKRDADGISHMDLAVEGIGCAGCIRKIENGLKELPGVTEARLNFTNRRLAAYNACMAKSTTVVGQSQFPMWYGAAISGM